MNKFAKSFSNLSLFALFLCLLALPLTVIDFGYYDPYVENVLSTQDFREETLEQSEAELSAQSQDPFDTAYYEETPESSLPIDINSFDYYQAPSLYLGVPEGVQ